MGVEYETFVAIVVVFVVFMAALIIIDRVKRDE